MLRSAAAALLIFACPAFAAPQPVVAFDDPTGDADGPGTYQPPGDTMFMPGDFDLRRLAVLVDGDDVVFEITLGAVIRLPDTQNRTNLTPVPLLGGVYLQNVDVYLDTARGTTGVSRAIPGRRVAFAGNRTWESAVVITPQPGPVRAVIAGALGQDAARVVVPDRVTTRGRTLVARVPAAALGGPPQPSWGYSVHVSGARWERSFSGQDRLRDSQEADAYTMPVTTVREAFAFGGAPASSRAHPRVVDVLLPAGVDQRKVLAAFDARADTYARVPFVYADGTDPFAIEGAGAAAPGPAAGAGEPSITLPEALTVRALPSMAARPPPSQGWTVADVAGDLVTIAGPTAGLGPLRIGRVLGPDGIPVAKVVIGRVLEGGITASVVEGRERVVRGATVRFDGP